MSLSRFIGKAQTAIDGKGRSSFPREFRRQLGPTEGNEFVVACGPNHTIRLYLTSEFDKFMAEIDALKDRQQAEIFRNQLEATTVEMDGQNRILIPKNLLEYAGLTTEVVYAADRGWSLDLWNPERYNAKYGKKTEEDVTAFSEMFYKLGLPEGLDDKR